MTAYPPPEAENRVVPFRRSGPFASRAAPPPPGPAKDLAEFEQNDDEPEDFRHRMRMNALAGLVLITLIIFGWWIVDAMVAIRDHQNCAVSGRKNCETIVVPTPPP